MVIPAAILAETDFLSAQHLGIDAELDFLDGLAVGGCVLEPFTSQDLDRCHQLIAEYRDSNLGLADTAVIAAAERLGIRRILTVDERDFRLVRPAHVALVTFCTNGLSTSL